MSAATDKIKITSPKDGKKNTKKHVDTEPTLNESRDQGRVDGLIMAGLGESVDLVKYRHVIQNPVSSVSSTQYRDAVGAVLERLLEVVFSDPALYQKVRQDLQNKHMHEGVVGNIVKDVVRDVADNLLHKHLGVIGKAISVRTIKKKKKKP